MCTGLSMPRHRKQTICSEKCVHWRLTHSSQWETTASHYNNTNISALTLTMQLQHILLVDVIFHMYAHMYTCYPYVCNMHMHAQTHPHSPPPTHKNKTKTTHTHKQKAKVERPKMWIDSYYQGFPFFASGVELHQNLCGACCHPAQNEWPAGPHLRSAWTDAPVHSPNQSFTRRAFFFFFSSLSNTALCIAKTRKTLRLLTTVHVPFSFIVFL